MLTLEKYNQIKKKYGKSASWAIWAEEGSTPKSNISDLNVFCFSDLFGKISFIGIMV